MTDPLTRPPIRILVADDHPTFVLGLRTLIEREADMDVIACATTGEAAVELYRRERPDVVMMDLRLPDMSGVDVMLTIRNEFPEARIIILSAYDWEEDIHLAIQSGAASYLLKDAGTEEIAETIRGVYRDDPTIPETVARRLQRRGRREELTERELEVLRMIVLGRTNKEIASSLCIAENTVRTHLKSLFAKLRVHHRTDAAVVAIRRGIVHMD